MKLLNVFWIIFSSIGVSITSIGLIVFINEGNTIMGDDILPLFITFPGYLFGVITSIVLMKKTKKMEPLHLIFSILSVLSVPLWFTIVDSEGFFSAQYYFIFYTFNCYFSLTLSIVSLKKVNKWSKFRKNQIRMNYTTGGRLSEEYEFTESEEILD
jgi:hypothetical protein